MAELLAPHSSYSWSALDRSRAPQFWAGSAAGELRFVRCGQCGTPDFPPAPVCRGCRSRQLAWEVSGGLGEVYSWTVVWRPPTPDLRVPYAPVIVTLDEGYRMLSNLVGADSEAVTVGMRVRVDWVPAGDGRRLPCFRPA